jgi:hypothetical protein
VCISFSPTPTPFAFSLAPSFSPLSVGIFAYRLLRADYSSNQTCHNQGRQLARLGLCWFHMWPSASDGLEHSWIISTSMSITPTLLHLLPLGSAFHLWNCWSLWVLVYFKLWPQGTEIFKSENLPDHVTSTIVKSSS